nr:LOW QUALITY PROTEIN: protein NCBP2AS2 [Anolis sagrei ordinatus]
MVVRRVLLALLSDPRLQERLAGARPIRAAARLAASALTRGLRLRNAFLRELREEAPGPVGTAPRRRREEEGSLTQARLAPSGKEGRKEGRSA